MVLSQTANLMIRNNVCPDSEQTFKSWMTFLRTAHHFGYLYLGFENAKIKLAAVGYRSNHTSKMPEKEHGDKLYVPVLASESGDKWALKRLLTHYIKHNPFVKYISYCFRGRYNDIRRHQIGQR